jgi:hypothetical protein
VPKISRSLVMAVAMGIIVAPAVAAQTLPLEIATLTSPVRPGQSARVVVRTAPRTACLLIVHYNIGPKGFGLTARKTADPRGIVTWIWRVDPKATPGTWPIIVHCTKEDRPGLAWARLETSFVVR